jgi:arylsulfatase
VKDRHVHFEINSFGHVSGAMVSKDTLPNGHSVVEIEVKPDHPRPASSEPLRGASPFPGNGTMKIDGAEEGRTAFVNIPASGGYWSPAESLDIGTDLGSAVSKEYSSPNRFTGTIDSITLQLHETQGSNSAARNDGHS